MMRSKTKTKQLNNLNDVVDDGQRTTVGQCGAAMMTVVGNKDEASRGKMN